MAAITAKVAWLGPQNVLPNRVITKVELNRLSLSKDNAKEQKL